MAKTKDTIKKEAASKPLNVKDLPGASSSEPVSLTLPTPNNHPDKYIGQLKDRRDEFEAAEAPSTVKGLAKTVMNLGVFVLSNLVTLASAIAANIQNIETLAKENNQQGRVLNDLSAKANSAAPAPVDHAAREAARAARSYAEDAFNEVNLLRRQNLIQTVLICLLIVAVFWLFLN